ncbi:hypothetical protein BCR33DRAFT_261390 [Rhizoclosmatium globosum]|uniref:Uncharacterized protein n=1 Tax=Rhizoclosmatium globosum TaxID=329046 RepID=A0A1Y2C982_9FUNG|nr:hypothetical protein BCR33DRAFT_261390 [Rhizoclosmatium globosum]|eukprot:ORY43414.1 hypothetical protein BCR33DRAFT_261390 [Rhizoclosmatium globosum]
MTFQLDFASLRYMAYGLIGASTFILVALSFFLLRYETSGFRANPINTLLLLMSASVVGISCCEAALIQKGFIPHNEQLVALINPLQTFFASSFIWLYIQFSWQRSESAVIEIYPRRKKYFRRVAKLSPYLCYLATISEAVHSILSIYTDSVLASNYQYANIAVNAAVGLLAVLFDAILLITFIKYLQSTEYDSKIDESFLIISWYGAGAIVFALSAFCFYIPGVIGINNDIESEFFLNIVYTSFLAIVIALFAMKVQLFRSKARREGEQRTKLENAIGKEGVEQLLAKQEIMRNSVTGRSGDGSSNVRSSVAGRRSGSGSDSRSSVTSATISRGSIICPVNNSRMSFVRESITSRISIAPPVPARTSVTKPEQALSRGSIVESNRPMVMINSRSTSIGYDLPSTRSRRGSLSRQSITPSQQEEQELVQLVKQTSRRGSVSAPKDTDNEAISAARRLSSEIVQAELEDVVQSFVANDRSSIAKQGRQNSVTRRPSFSGKNLLPIDDRHLELNVHNVVVDIPSVREKAETDRTRRSRQSTASLTSSYGKHNVEPLTHGSTFPKNSDSDESFPAEHLNQKRGQKTRRRSISLESSRIGLPPGK